MPSGNPYSDIDTDIDTDTDTSLIPRYKVLFHNDEVTTFEFVIAVLEAFFNKNATDARHTAHEIHEAGIGVAGVYPLEVAQLKQQQTLENARMYRYPLIVTLEKS
jgi:ATP-dependent Clp protease adaptor protein ClpS